MLSTRPKLTDQLLLRAVSHLTERDRRILHACACHRVLTVEHVRDLFFDALNTAQHRLTLLYRLRVLDRFQPFDTGCVAGSYHYVVGQLGAMVLAAERETDIYTARRRWRPEKALAIARSQRLAHLVGVNGVFSALAREGRRLGVRGLTEWEPEWRLEKWCGRIVRPDGWGVWQEGHARVGFYLEYDRGTETVQRVVDKLAGYARLEAATNERDWVLFWFGSRRREFSVRAAMRHAKVPVATACHDAGLSPSDGVGCRWMAPAAYVWSISTAAGECLNRRPERVDVTPLTDTTSLDVRDWGRRRGYACRHR